jgi:hypothetical protein
MVLCTLNTLTVKTMNKKTTSPSVASQAGRVLQDSNASAVARSLAASALSQRNTGHQTGAAMEDIAARVLDGSKYSKETKSLAGSVLSQSNEQR